ncbi:hypothetical protein D7D52_34970 [Nocardia yunnanensis]|uniref:Uncharacterized protein n=1 Tax=Nocardia yunnanensis TaxID=2382165 RepID=A0A386ZNN5_9NOCA|nr:hypothetical protein [Nocardia yunnanensis]AYF78175.1 hypothetical protein D7D52_34970 [Nocardia yunnanensis]
MSDIEPATERAILDQLRKAQAAHHGGDQETASAVLDQLFADHGRETVEAVHWRQANDQLAADVNLFSMFGVAGLRGDD